MKFATIEAEGAVLPTLDLESNTSDDMASLKPFVVLAKRLEKSEAKRDTVGLKQ